MNYAFRTSDHPEANGRTPAPGELSYRLVFPLEEHGLLTIRLGKPSIDSLRLFLDTLAKQRTHRDDGWPLCPHCGEDELWSALLWDGLHPPERPPLANYIAAGLTCYRCGWTQEAQK